MKLIRIIIIIALCSLVVSACNVKQDSTDYGVYIGLNPEHMDVLYRYSTVVIDAAYYSKSDIHNLHQKGIKVYTYLNIGTIETFRENHSAYQSFVLGEYDDWPGEYWIDVSQAAWQEYIAECAESLVDKGVDGFFLDNIDVYYHFHCPEILNGLISIIERLEQYEKEIIVNGGDVFVTEAVLESESPLVQITGVNQECVFTNIDFENDILVEQDSGTSQYYQTYLEQCGTANLMVYITEYMENDTKEMKKKIEDYCQEHHFLCFVASTKDLNAARNDS